MHEVFNRQFPPIHTGVHSKLRAAARLMTSDNGVSIGWRPTYSPLEGDAVFLSMSEKVTTHIGIVFYSRRKRNIIHALKGVGVVTHDDRRLKTMGLRIKGFWTYASLF